MSFYKTLKLPCLTLSEVLSLGSSLSVLSGVSLSHLSLMQAIYYAEEPTFLSGPFWLAGTIGVDDKTGGDGWNSSGLLIACAYDNITITLYYTIH